MPLVDRLLGKAMLAPLAMLLLVCMVVALFAQMLQLGESSMGLNVTPLEVMQIIVYTLPALLGILLPVVLFFAVMLAVGKLHREHALLGLLCCGVRPLRWLGMPSVLGLGISAAGVVMSVWLEPWGLQQLRAVLIVSGQNALLRSVVAKQWFHLGEYWLYIDEVRPNHWQRVIVLAASSEQVTQVILAEQVQVQALRGRMQLAMRMQRGMAMVFHAKNGVKSWWHFGQATYHLDIATLLQRKVRKLSKVQEMSWQQLQVAMHQASSSDLQARATSIHAAIVWQRKLSMPLASLLFAWLGMALAHNAAQKSRGYALLLGGITLISYYYLGRSLELAAREGKLGSGLAAWCPDAMVLLLFLWLWWRQPSGQT